MVKKYVFSYAVFCLTLILLIVPEMCPGGGIEDMLILKHIDIATTPRNEGFPSISYNSTDKEFMVMWHTGGKLSNCNNFFDPACGNWHSIDGQRISPDGELLDLPLEISPLERCGGKDLPRVAYNSFKNEYMVAFQYGPVNSSDEEIYITKIDNHGSVQLQPRKIYQNTQNQSMPLIVFNDLERSYLMAFNDRSRSPSASQDPLLTIVNYFTNSIDNLACILDEDGNNLNQSPFVIGSPRGLQYNNQGVYNSRDNTFFVVWEDFRHVNNVFQNSDLYGALLDASGNMIGEETPFMDDFGTPDEGSQNNQNLAYNPDQNEFLIAWGASDQPSLEAWGGVVGIILQGNGTPKGEPFVICDAPMPQNSPQIVYVASQQKYFVIWSDYRNDTVLYPGMPFYFAENVDVYGTWLNPDGTAASDDIPLCTDAGLQAWPALAYDPIKERFLIAWWDRNAPQDYEPAQGGGGMGPSMKGDVKGVIYGAP